MKHLKSGLKYYHDYLKERQGWRNYWFRLFLAGLFAFFLFFVWTYAQNAYGEVVDYKGKPLFVDQLVLNWFFAGVITGVVFVVLLYFGELVMGFRKVAKALDSHEFVESNSQSVKVSAGGASGNASLSAGSVKSIQRGQNAGGGAVAKNGAKRSGASGRK